jgi:hypothetical protein
MAMSEVTALLDAGASINPTGLSIGELNEAPGAPGERVVDSLRSSNDVTHFLR